MDILRRRGLFGVAVVLGVLYIVMGVGASIFGDLDGVGERVSWAVAGVAIGTSILALAV